MKIMLAYISGSTARNESSFFTDLLPVGLCSIHAVLRLSGYDADLANLSGMGKKESDAILLKIRPSVLGLSQWTHNRHETIAFASRAKKLLPDCIIILGGAHATAEAELILERHPEIDLIVAGEGESTTLELMSALKNQHPIRDIAGLVIRSDAEYIRTLPRKRITDLDSMPYPYSFLHEALGTAPVDQAQFVSTARGCPSSCRFCGSPTFWGRSVVSRSPESVINEFRFLRQRFGLLYLSLRDDTFTLDRARVMRLCTLLTESRLNFFWNCQTRVETIDDDLLLAMKRAGCECIQLGVESGSPEMLSYLGKKSDLQRIIKAADMVHNAGLSLSVYLISGIPGESATDKGLTRKLLKRIKPDDIQIAPLAFYPGTAIHSEFLSKGVIDQELFENSGAAALVVDDPDGISAKKLLEGLSYTPPGFNSRRTSDLEARQGYTAVGCMQRGDYLLEAGDTEGARFAFSEITKKEPGHPWGWLLLAELYEEEGRIRDAAGCYEKLLELVPAHTGAKAFLEKNKRRPVR